MNVAVWRRMALASVACGLLFQLPANRWIFVTAMHR